MAILQVKELIKTYGKGDTTVTALGGVSFSVDKGEFVAIVGTSGSSKSTLMHLIGGVDRPTSSTVTVDGNEIFKQNESELAIFRRRNIGLIYQFYNLIPHGAKNAPLLAHASGAGHGAKNAPLLAHATGAGHGAKNAPLLAHATGVVSQ